MMTKPKDIGILYKFGYPPYKVVSNKNNQTFITSGGGGASKTGIPNEIELFNYPQVNDGDLNKATVESIKKFNTNDIVVMDMDILYDYLVTAENKDIKEYLIVNDEVENMKQETETKLRDRRKSESEQSEPKIKTWKLILRRKIENVFPIDADNQEFAEVKCVKYTHRGNLIVAGSLTGCVKIFKRYDEDNPMKLTLLRTFEDVSSVDHSGIFDFDISPMTDEFVTITEKKSGHYARVWNIMHGNKVTELALTCHKGVDNPSNQSQYKFQHCQYLNTLGTPRFLLFCTHIGTENRRIPAFLSVWGALDPSVSCDYQFVSQISLGYDTGDRRKPLKPTALSVSLGTHNNQMCSLAAIGSGEGQVDVYCLPMSNFNLKPHQIHKLELIYRRRNAHSFFITDLIFLRPPSSHDSFYTSANNDFSLLSIGIDSMLRLHTSRPNKLQFLNYEFLRKSALLLIVLFFIDRFILIIFNL